MNLLKLAAQIFLIYLIYRLIVNVVIPIYRSTKQMRKQFGDMQSKMQGMNRQQQNGAYPKPPAQESAAPTKEGDYIDFEEVKEK